MKTKFARQQAVTFALTLAERTSLAPDSYERHLLDRFVRGSLTLAQVEGLLAKRKGSK